MSPARQLSIGGRQMAHWKLTMARSQPRPGGFAHRMRWDKTLRTTVDMLVLTSWVCIITFVILLAEGCHMRPPSEKGPEASRRHSVRELSADEARGALIDMVE